MKKVIFVLAALALSFGSFAQADSSMNKMKHDKMPMKGKMDMSKQNGVMMMDGEMMVMKDGKTMPMKKGMTMRNGTKVMTDGMCMKKDRTKMTMKEGDHMDMEGNMHSMKETKTVDH